MLLYLIQFSGLQFFSSVVHTGLYQKQAKYESWKILLHVLYVLSKIFFSEQVNNLHYCHDNIELFSYSKHNLMLTVLSRDS